MTDAERTDLELLAKLLELTAPLIAVDTETTGLFTDSDRVWQLGVVKLYPTGEVTDWETLVNPEVRIPAEIAEGYVATIGDPNELVRRPGVPTFKQLAPVLAKKFTSCDFVGYNLDFDLAILGAEFKRANVPFEFNCRMIDALRIARQRESRDLTWAVKRYLGEERRDAHHALPDATYHARVISGVLEAYPDLPRTVEGLHRLFYETPPPGCVDPEGKFRWVDNEAVFTFGKPGIKGRRLRDVDPGYLRWMLAQGFDQHTKRIVRDALEGVYPRREVKA